MSIWDFNPSPPNIPMKTMGGEVFWENVESRAGFRLQWNPFLQHYRILDSDDVRVAWGEEGQMRAEFRRLTGGVSASKAQYGDIIGVHRVGALYDHYGIYENDNRIYEYNGDLSKIDIHVTSLHEFTNGTGSYFVLEFPKHYGKPAKIEMCGNISGLVGVNLSGIIDAMLKSEDYHLYSPQETIRRAKSRLGEEEYDLFTNNCEHFAIWCKTGIRESHQINSLLRTISKHNIGV